MDANHYKILMQYSTQRIIDIVNEVSNLNHNIGKVEAKIYHDYLLKIYEDFVANEVKFQQAPHTDFLLLRTTLDGNRPYHRKAINLRVYLAKIFTPNESSTNSQVNPSTAELIHSRFDNVTKQIESIQQKLNQNDKNFQTTMENVMKKLNMNIQPFHITKPTPVNNLKLLFQQECFVTRIEVTEKLLNFSNNNISPQAAKMIYSDITAHYESIQSNQSEIETQFSGSVFENQTKTIEKIRVRVTKLQTKLKNIFEPGTNQLSASTPQQKLSRQMAPLIEHIKLHVPLKNRNITLEQCLSNLIAVINLSLKSNE